MQGKMHGQKGREKNAEQKCRGKICKVKSEKIEQTSESELLVACCLFLVASCILGLGPATSHYIVITGLGTSYWVLICVVVDAEILRVDRHASFPTPKKSRSDHAFWTCRFFQPHKHIPGDS